MSSETSTRMSAQAFLAAFFAPPNRFEFAKIQAGERTFDKLQPWIERLTGPVPLPTVLPAWVGHEVQWYAVATTEAQVQVLGEELLAFVGHSYSTFRGPRARLDAHDPIEAAVLAFTGGAAFRFIGRRDPDGKFTTMWEVLETMRQVWDRRQVRAAQVQRPTGRVLRDFEMALQAHDRTSAERELAYLAEQNRLDASNLAYLRVRLLAEFGSWAELLALDESPAMLASRRPQAVSEAILRAVYHRELARFETDHDPAGAIKHFHTVVLSGYGSLFGARAGMATSEALKSFMLLAVGVEAPRPHLRDELLQATTEAGTLAYLRSLAATSLVAVPPPPADLLAAAERMELDGDFDEALRLAAGAQASQRRARILLVCAYELQSLESERQALEAVAALDASDRAALLASRRNRTYLSAISGDSPQTTSLAAPLLPSNWVEWLSYLKEQPDWSRAGAVAAQGSLEWSPEEYLGNIEAVMALDHQLAATRPAQADELVYNALPYMLAYLQRDPAWPRPDCRGIYGQMLDLLVVSTDGGDPDLVIFNELVEVGSEQGLDAARYKEVLGYASDLWSQIASPAKLHWTLDLLDLLVSQPCPSPERRVAFLHEVVARVRSFMRRVGADQWAYLSLLIKDLGETETYTDLFAEVARETAEVSDVLTRLASRTVLIYTLTESVGIRVKAILEESSPGIVVHLSHDHDGSDRLKALARQGDLVVVATASAKHAATTFIETHLGSQAALLRPAGKGSASMLRELRRHLEIHGS